MTELQGDNLNEAICMSSRLPLCWEPIDGSLSEGELVNVNDNNLVLLNAIAFMEAESYSDPDDHNVAANDFARLNSKVELLLTLVSQLVSHYQLVPESNDFTLSSTQLSWPVGALHANIDAEGLFKLYLHPAVAVPLLIPAIIDGAASAKIHGLSVTVHNALEKYLFRQHRRRVADARRSEIASSDQ